MAQVGVSVQATEIPASGSTAYNTANGFLLGFTDWGPVGQPIAVTNLGNGATSIGTPSGSGSPASSRTSTCATVYDALDTFFHEDGHAQPVVYVSRVVGPSPVNASLVLKDSTGATALTLTALYPGSGGNGIFVAVTNSGSTFTITLQDSAGNVLAFSPSLSSNAAAVTWAATTPLITAIVGPGALPVTLAATAMGGGTDNRNTASISNWQTAVNAFGPTLGPGQVWAPGQTNTVLPGIWSLLGTHAQANNRVGICDMDDGQPAATLTSEMSAVANSAVAPYLGFWAGSRLIPGTVPGVSRTVAPSSVIAALCARVDQTGNQNIAGAGLNYALAYASSPSSFVTGSPRDTYSANDLDTLNGSGINTFQVANGVPCNYGFVSAELSSQDTIYWQFNHSRLRMALIAQSQILGQQFMFSQIDGQGMDQAAFANALQGMLQGYYTAGALYGATAAQAYSVDTGSDINTPTTIAQGDLNAALTVSFSYFAQSVNININVKPIS